MTTQSIIAYLAFLIALVLFTREAWTSPETFLKKRREARRRAYQSGFGVIARHPYIRNLDLNPGWELAVTRAAFVLLYLLTAGVGILIIRGILNSS